MSNERYFPGLEGVIAGETAISTVDGGLTYRGYSIEDLSRKGSFLEVAYLLQYGELPNTAEKKEWVKNITYHTMVHEQLIRFFSGFRRDAHPMAVMCGVVGALSAFYHDSTDINDPVQREIACHRLIAKMPTIAAMTSGRTIRALPILRCEPRSACRTAPRRAASMMIGAFMLVPLSSVEVPICTMESALEAAPAHRSGDWTASANIRRIYQQKSGRRAGTLRRLSRRSALRGTESDQRDRPG